MGEFVGLIIIGVIWLFFRGLGKANKTRPGQPNGQNGRSALPYRDPRFPARNMPPVDISSLFEPKEDEDTAEYGVHEAQFETYESDEMTVHEMGGFVSGPPHNDPEAYVARDPERTTTRMTPNVVEKKKAASAKKPATGQVRARPLTAKRMRNAVIMAEIIAPPKSRRRRVS